MSILYRCDECCDVLGDVDGGIVYDCDIKVEQQLNIQHICEDCLNGIDDLTLVAEELAPDLHTQIVHLKDNK